MSAFAQHFSNKVWTDRSQVTLSGCEGLTECLAELLHPNKLHVTAMLTVLNQKMHPDPMITSLGGCQECPLTDPLYTVFCLALGGIFVSHWQDRLKCLWAMAKYSGRIFLLTFCSCGQDLFQEALSVSWKIYSVQQDKPSQSQSAQCSVIIVVKTQYGLCSTQSVSNNSFWLIWSKASIPASTIQQLIAEVEDW